LTLIDQRVNGLRNDIAKESKTRYENIEHLENCLEVTTLSINSNFNAYRVISLSSKKRLKMLKIKEMKLTTH
jgi:hypothetical protein